MFMQALQDSKRAASLSDLSASKSRFNDFSDRAVRTEARAHLLSLLSCVKRFSLANTTCKWLRAHMHALVPCDGHSLFFAVLHEDRTRRHVAPALFCTA